ncbi:MAG: InlB B-repeat-containing protein, partial [Duncaniella sp.]|nr:InlB B-repeat-containing protein [Duncaniella sp.]
MSVCLSTFAALRTEEWTLNPSDYRYDMSLYFTMSSRDYEDLTKYEIGAFVGDECRGLAEKLDLPDNGSCLYMRIRSNTPEGDEIEFRMRDRSTGETVVLKGKDGAAFQFKADQRVGLPSDPYVMMRYFNVTVEAGENGTVAFENGLYAEGTVIDLTAVPSEGYHFVSWSDGSTDAQRKLTVNGDVELSASFAVTAYKVVFKIGENVIATLDVDYGSTIAAPEAPALEGHTFGGWADLPATMPAHDIEITGSYTLTIYKAVFKIDNEVVTTLDLAFGAKVEAPAAPAKEGYTFDGWVGVPETMPANDIEVTGNYTTNIYKIAFRIGEEVVSMVELPFGSPIETPAVPEITGYTFEGWADVPATVPAKDLEITGSYAVNKYKAVFKIGDEVVSTVEVAYGEAIEAPAVADKEGHTFSGWTNLPATMPANDVEITGTYTAGTYEAIFKIGDEVIATIRASFGSELEIPAAPEKEGYTFAGWADLPATMPARDLEIIGSYTVNVYKAVFKLGEEVLTVLEVPYGEAVAAPAVPDKEGHTFDGWFTIPETMPGNDIEVLGSYVPNVYKAIFKLGDEVLATLDVGSGS